MRILYLNFTEKISGGETSLLYYLEELKQYITPVVVSPRRGPFSERLNLLGIKNYTFGLNLLSKKNPLPFIVSLYHLIRIVSKEKIDIIHANGMASNQLAAITSKLTRKPLVLHLQNFVEEEYYHKYLGGWSDRIISVSDIMTNSLTRYLEDHKKLVILKHAVPLSDPIKKNYFLHKELRIDTTKRLIAIIGLLEERKGHEYFIRAAKLVGNTAHFLIIGDSLFTDDKYKQKLKTLVHQLKLTNVTFLGYRADILNILTEIDVLVMPSINEPLGVVALEASSAGVPVVGFNSGGLPEIIEDGKTGFLVDERDFEELAEKIIVLLKKESLRIKLGTNARQRIAKEFNITINAQKLLKIYKELCT